MQSTFGKHDEYDDYIMGIIVLATADIFIWDFVWSYIKYCF